MKYKTALLVGRFQPFHKGHMYLIKKTLDCADKVIIGIGSANVKDAENPWSYEERKRMVELVIHNEKVEDAVIKIVPLDDFHHDEKWRNNVNKQTNKQFDVVVGNNEWTNRIFETAGYPVLRFGFYKRYLYEGEKIRKLMKEGKKWEKRVPEYLIKFLILNLC